MLSPAHDDKAPWLEPGAGSLWPPSESIPVDQVRAAALLSMAITFKRVVDMLEPMAVSIAAAIAREGDAEKAAAKKGKRP